MAESETENYIDGEAYMNEIRKQILNTGRYVKSEIIIPYKGSGIKIPYANVESHNISPIEMAQLITILEIQIDTIKKRFPEAASLEKKIKCKKVMEIDDKNPKIKF